MTVHALAGTPPPPTALVDVDALRHQYYTRTPDLSDPSQRVAFHASGHRGSALRGAFNERHVMAITQAICDYRRRRDIRGPLFIGRDTHGLSEPAFNTALEVLGANRVDVMIPADGRSTPTPAIARAIVTHNRHRCGECADGIVVTPSLNPPAEGGIKYHCPTGGAADALSTRWIQDRANALLATGQPIVPRFTSARARRSNTTHVYDYIGAYVRELAAVVDMEAIAQARLRIGVDPLGGATARLWQAIADWYGLDVEVVDEKIDPTFHFLPLDWDGQIRMDCASPYVMSRLIRLRDCFDIAFGNDTDADHHGIVTQGVGLMPANHYLAAVVDYLFTHRPQWGATAAAGKSIVSSSVVDRVAARVGRPVVETPAGFKWFAPGLLAGSLGVAGEESASASCLQRNGSVWTPDKDGIVMDLLAAEILARTGRDPAERYTELAQALGTPVFERLEAAATADEQARLAALTPADVRLSSLAGEAVLQTITTVPGTGAPIGGVKVVTANGWFAARVSHTRRGYKLYAESFRGEHHLHRIQAEARSMLGRVMGSAPARVAIQKVANRGANQRRPRLVVAVELDARPGDAAPDHRVSGA
jgi:phosphoglucomutase